jgi:hypothetical protein
MSACYLHADGTTELAAARKSAASFVLSIA